MNINKVAILTAAGTGIGADAAKKLASHALVLPLMKVLLIYWKN